MVGAIHSNIQAEKPGCLCKGRSMRHIAPVESPLPVLEQGNAREKGLRSS